MCFYALPNVKKQKQKLFYPKEVCFLKSLKQIFLIDMINACDPIFFNETQQ
jgi:hypothetical protein